ncbi:MAG: ATP-binding protein [Bacillota bacterium]
MNDLKKLNLKMHALVIFRRLLSDALLTRLSGLLACAGKPLAERVNNYASFVSLLYTENGNLTDSILERVLSDENIYVLKRAQNQPTGSRLEECLLHELKVLEEISQLTAQQVREFLGYDGYLPVWETTAVDFHTAYMNRMDNISSIGYGMFSKHHMFVVKNGAISPVRSPDCIQLSDLKSYEAERQAVIANTLALLKGKPAANVLLYGDAGTGKSSTVKAIVNAYKGRGLRLIEITKTQFRDIPVIAQELSANPLKFILFIDDLSFTGDNDDFRALKAVLEGSVFAKTVNVAIYATSNRRHLVKESFSDRAGDDIHRNETIQELASLSERFGLSVNFFKPDKERYLEIIRGLKTQYGIRVQDDELEKEAEMYALRRGGRSPRIARQFMDYLISIEE